MTKESFNVLDVREWHALDYPDQTINSASIARTWLKPGDYHLMECVDGYELYKVVNPIPVTELRINGDVVMIDDPMHWIGMQRLAEACEGRVFVAGLGLGILLHHIVNNPWITRIDVVEINQDVIDLVSPHLPADPRVTIHHDDALDEKWTRADYDTFVLDLWVKSGTISCVAGHTSDATLADTTKAFLNYHPRARVYVWGVRDTALNPAVEECHPLYTELCNEIIKRNQHD